MKRIFKDRRFHVSHLEHLESLNGLLLASFRSRGIAFLTDLFFILIIVLLISLPAAISDYNKGSNEDLLLSIDLFISLKGILALILYFGSLTYLWKGQTLGKRLMKIRVISLKSKKITLWQSIERSMGYATSSLEAGFGFFQAAWSENSQTTHDKLAETIVIKSR